MSARKRLPISLQFQVRYVPAALIRPISSVYAQSLSSLWASWDLEYGVLFITDWSL